MFPCHFVKYTLHTKYLTLCCGTARHFYITAPFAKVFPEKHHHCCLCMYVCVCHHQTWFLAAGLANLLHKYSTFTQHTTTRIIQIQAIIQTSVTSVNVFVYSYSLFSHCGLYSNLWRANQGKIKIFAILNKKRNFLIQCSFAYKWRDLERRGWQMKGIARLLL